MKNRPAFILWMICILASFLVGCNQREKASEVVSSGTDRSAQQSIRSMADLRMLLIPTLETSKIVEALGEPHWKENLGEGREEWHFSIPPFPAGDAMRGTAVAGVSIGITNGRLANWGCTYVGSANEGVSRSQPVLGLNTQPVNSVPLQFFLVRSEPIGDGRFIDTERFPKLGFVARNPILAVHRLKEVTLDEQVLSQQLGRTNWSFGIFLTPEDGAKLKAITATNISIKILIMIGGEPVSAPTIRAPLETGSFAIECGDRSLMESVKKHLAELERQGQ